MKDQQAEKHDACWTQTLARIDHLEVQQARAERACQERLVELAAAARAVAGGTS